MSAPATSGSYAVMAQRHEPHDSLDHFPTPCWATRALCNWIEGNLGCLDKQTAWEPACAEGHMVKPLREFFAVVRSSDVHDYGGLQDAVYDFLIPGMESLCIQRSGVDWIVTNPPFRLAEQFVFRALDVARVGAAFLVRTSFLEGVGRHDGLFTKRRPFAVLQFAERVPMHKGKLTATGSTATSYCWIVWTREAIAQTRMDWIPPCRRQLERAGDYDSLVAA